MSFIASKIAKKALETIAKDKKLVIPLDDVASTKFTSKEELKKEICPKRDRKKEKEKKKKKKEEKKLKSNLKKILERLS